MVCSIIVESKYFFLTCYDDWFIFKMYTIYTSHSCTPITQSYFLILFSHITNASPDYSCLALCPSVYGYGYQYWLVCEHTDKPWPQRRKNEKQNHFHHAESKRPHVFYLLPIISIVNKKI